VLVVSASGAVNESVTLHHTANLALNDLNQEVPAAFPRALASSNEAPSAYPPSYVNDGSTSTFWVSGLSFVPTTHPEQIAIDFGGPVSVGRVTMTPRVNYGPKTYDVQTSSDGTTWTTRATETNIANATRVTTFAPVSARYVRLNVRDSYDSQSPPRNTQIRELDIRPN
jgi:hypothetical protein